MSGGPILSAKTTPAMHSAIVSATVTATGLRQKPETSHGHRTTAQQMGHAYRQTRGSRGIAEPHDLPVYAWQSESRERLGSCLPHGK